MDLGNIFIARTWDETQVLSEEILNTSPVIFGFDTESNPDGHKVSLIQISNGVRTYLFQLHGIDVLPGKLKTILTNKKIIKIGVDIEEDVHRIYKTYNIIMKGCIDLQNIAYTKHIPNCSMVDLAFIYVPGFPGKDCRQRMTRWDGELTDQQKIYAAGDAYYPLKIYHNMLNMKMDNYVIQEIDETTEINDYKNWIQEILMRSPSDRIFSSVVNQTINSYGFWVRRYVPTKRRELAIKYLNMFIEQKIFPFDGQRKVFMKVITNQ